MTTKKKESDMTPIAAPEKKETKTDAKLQAALDAINKELGTTLSRVNEKKVEPIERISSGSLSLDYAMGGGWARGRVHEIYGPEGGGKTMQTLFAVASAQRLGLKVAFIDAEQALDPLWAQKLGVDIGNLFFEQPDEGGEQALNLVDKLCQTGAFGLIVVDSVSALVPKSELEGAIGDVQMGVQARMMSQALRKISQSAAHGNTAVIFVNQLRMKLGVMFGNPETTTGGNALKFYSSIRLDVRKVSKSEVLDERKEQIGHTQRIKNIKNKTAPPFREAAVPINYLSGVRLADDAIESLRSITGVDDAPISIAGVDYKNFGALLEAIRADEKLLATVRKEIKTKAGF